MNIEDIKKWLEDNGFNDDFIVNYQEVGGKPEGGNISEVIKACIKDLNLVEADQIKNIEANALERAYKFVNEPSDLLWLADDVRKDDLGAWNDK